VADNPLIFLKLGGSLITDKFKPETVQKDILSDCLAQVRHWMQENPTSGLLLGHGSGSFGHNTANTFHTREGVSTEQEWLGYAEVWYSARKLNNYVVDACAEAGIPVVDFPISAGMVTDNRKIYSYNLDPIRDTLEQGLVPVVHGDVCIDRSLGGTILSTEEIFSYFSTYLKPNRVLLAGVERGVYADYPANQKLIPHISTDADPSNYLQGSKAKDVTGGMASKVASSQAIVKANPGMEILIFSGLEPNAVYKLLSGVNLGTCIS